MSIRSAARGTFIALIAVLTALPFLAAPAHASPPAPPRAEVSTTADSVHVTIFNGTLAVEDGSLVFRNQSGAVVANYPLTFVTPDARSHSIAATVNGATATLTPPKNAAASFRNDVADRDGYRSKKERDDAALARFNSEMAAGMTISTIIGTAIGAVIGGVAAGVLCGATATPAIIACIPVGAALGGIAGTVIGGGGSLINSAIRYFTTINSPFKNVGR
ncbi:hypothetical protein [Gordonia neofelifaecis]|uniref:DUF8020 domain-containing protein n=1 Tax=Gordonia neofelifaecis NRRL B-59395 TaxID=644548 RepID=F1YLP6_9ACTN|nr:hypothetical protein [Gordonia neofelifaecis]EGD54440.1 hypothetical protein SCNU_14199 [Gordonia neofelifaecis NRRL B-59395]